MCAADALQEMLLQVQDGVLLLFPALPQAWREKCVSFSHFRAEGGVLVTAAYAAGHVTRLALQGAKGKTVRLRQTGELGPLARACGWQPLNGAYSVPCAGANAVFKLEAQVDDAF